ncbi:hypothetical protein AB833_26880 [Chromatiales bacterium (ex Bugula neritina AB1)]|nr:hypothetical protein AB833_26880 [Chromatiales bacterium (ex Bugula neritina AB1)]
MKNRRPIGVLMLNTRFPRLPGDIGNPASFNYPVIYKTVERAKPDTVITERGMAENLETDFCRAAIELEEQHVSIITTSCGFLSPMQQQLSRLCNVPVVTSALVLLPLLGQIHGGIERLGIITFDSRTLGPRHFGKNKPAAVSGLQEDDTLRQTISRDLPELNRLTALQEVLHSAGQLSRQSESLRAIVLECTNLSPYKEEIRQHTGLPVYDIIDAIHWLADAQPVLL